MGGIMENRFYALLIIATLLMSMLVSSLKVEPAKASGIIYIRADGRVDPETAPISTSDNITYTLTANISESIVIERDSIVLDGAGYTVQGTGTARGISLSKPSNVTIKNTNLSLFQDGIWLDSVSNNTISGNNVTGCGNCGVWLDSSSNNTISGNNITGCGDYGIGLFSSSNNNTVSENDVTANTYGISLDISSFDTLSGNNVTANDNGIRLGGSSNNNTISENNATANNYYGLMIYSSSNNTINENTVTNNSGGIDLNGSSNNTISGNNVITNNYRGFLLSWSSSNTIYHNNFINNPSQASCYQSTNLWDDGYPSGGNYWSDYSGNDTLSGPYQNITGSDGIGDERYFINASSQDNYPLMSPWIPLGPTIYIRADGSVDPSNAPIQRTEDVYTLTGNTASDADGIVVERDNMTLDGAGYTLQGRRTGTGIDLSGRVNVTVRETQVEAFEYGIQLISSSNSTISENIVTKSKYEGIVLLYSSNNTVSENNVANNFYGILTGGSSNNTISGNNAESNDYGIGLWNSTNSIVYENTVTNNGYGIGLGTSSSNNTVSRNNVTASTYWGLWLYYSSNNSVSVNNAANNGVGIALSCSFGNTVSENSATNSFYGISTSDSSNNTICHNNFIGNTGQTHNYNSSINIWDSGYPSGGNYWSDFVGNDSYCGPYQNETGRDGIGDKPRVIDGANVDNYPLMGPWTVTGENTTVIPSSDLTITFGNVTSGGITVVNKTVTGPEHPPRFKLTGQYYNIETTANYSGRIWLRIVYDDSNLTLTEEQVLQLWHWNETSQQWDDTTTHVDTENNVIYGETDSLSPFTIISSFPWDINGDDYVGIDDIFEVATHFGAEKGQPNYEPLCDINKDDYIGIDDVFTVAQHFGEENP